MWPQAWVDNAHKAVSVSESGGTVRIVFGRLSDQYGPGAVTNRGQAEHLPGEHH